MQKVEEEWKNCLNKDMLRVILTSTPSVQDTHYNVYYYIFVLQYCYVSLPYLIWFTCILLIPFRLFSIFYNSLDYRALLSAGVRNESSAYCQQELIS